MKTNAAPFKKMIFALILSSGFLMTFSCAKERMQSNLKTAVRYFDEDAEDSIESVLVTEVPTVIEYQIPHTKEIPKKEIPKPSKETAQDSDGTTTKTPGPGTFTPTPSSKEGMEFDETASGDDNLDWVQTSSKAINFSTFQSLAWDKVAARRQWSNFIYSVILKEESIFLEETPKDIATFCPKYSGLNVGEKLNFWGQFIVAVAERESSWKPNTYYIETTMGTDPVTKSQIASEGLLQLSYQDEKNHRMDCGFDWEKDKNLDHKDEKKTIFDPLLNLRCGIKILAKQIKKHNKIVIGKGAYWSVIKQGHSSNKVTLISKRTKSLSFCH